MSIKEYIFKIKRVLAMYFTITLPFFAIFIPASFYEPKMAPLQDPIFTWYMFIVVGFPLIGSIMWLVISLLFSSSIFWFFLELFTWLLTTKKEREKYDKPFK